MEDKNIEKSVVIIGAGLVGALLAILLRKQGFDVTIFEKRPDPRTSAGEEGRSINLALSDRGLKALCKAGLENTVMTEAIPMKGRMRHSQDGSLHLNPYGEEGKA